jgi:hypothetical protein
MRDRLIRVENEPGLARDELTGAIVNTNVSEITAARQRKARQKQEREELEMLKSDVNEIKSILNVIVDKLNASDRR